MARNNAVHLVLYISRSLCSVVTLRYFMQETGILRINKFDEKLSLGQQDKYQTRY